MSLQTFDKFQLAIKYIYEKGNEAKISFLEALLMKEVNGSLKWNLNRKITWKIQHINPFSFE